MSVMSIESVAARHAGEYTCVATNGAGTISQSAMLVVNGTCPCEERPKSRYPRVAYCFKL